MVKKAVVYGAGQSGRGYVGRFLKEANYKVTFVEKDKHLVQLLNEDDHFSIHFYHKDRTPVLINNYNALSLEDDLSTVLKEADLILISVGEQNLGEVASSIANFLEEEEVPQVLTAENGTNPAKVLNKELEKHYSTDFSTRISQTAIFCSTINIEETRLDILSQNETYFPYDSEGFKGELDFPGAEPRDNFEYFFERKIYTYNCLSGLISYLGYIKGYEVYGEAANDIEISQIIDELLYELNPSLANYFDISLAEQNQFSNKAVDKFKDLKILDFVIKNGRAPRRKLGETERIYAPYKILLDQKKDPSIMYLIAGSALVYFEEIEFEGKEFNPVNELQSILKMKRNNPFIEQSAATYYSIVNNRKDIQLLNLLSTIRAN